MLSEMGALLEPLAAHGARVPAVPAMDPQDVGLDVAIAGEQLQADSASVLVTDVHMGELRVVEVLLVLVGLKHHAALDGLVTVSARVGRVQVFVVRRARQVVDRLRHDGVLLVVGFPLLAALAAGSVRLVACGPRHAGVRCAQVVGIHLLLLTHHGGRRAHDGRDGHRGRGLGRVDHVPVLRRVHRCLAAWRKINKKF